MLQAIPYRSYNMIHSGGTPMRLRPGSCSPTRSLFVLRCMSVCSQAVGVPSFKPWNKLYLGEVHLIRQGGDEDIEGGGARKIFRHSKGGSEKIRGEGSENLYTSKPTGGERAPKKMDR